MVLTPAEPKGLEYQSVCVLDPGRVLARLEDATGSTTTGTSRALREQEHRTAIDQLRVALSRATETLAFVDVAGDEDAHALSADLLEDAAPYHAGSATSGLRPSHDTNGVERHADVLGASRRSVSMHRNSTARTDESEETIDNPDPLARAPLALFGRTTAVHVGEHVEEQWQAPRVQGFRGRCAGRELRLMPIKWQLINKDAVDLRTTGWVARIAARAVGASRVRAWREGERRCRRLTRGGLSGTDRPAVALSMLTTQARDAA